MQFHLNPQENHNLATAGMSVIDCDGMAEWEIESSDDIKNICCRTNTTKSVNTSTTFSVLPIDQISHSILHQTRKGS